MNVKKELAARFSQQAAGKNHSQNKAYRKSAQLSSLKVFIGELLLFGNKERKETWWLFDSKLRQFYGLKMYEGLQ